MKLSETIKTINAVMPANVALERIKSQQKIDTPAVITALALSNPDELEGKGIYVNYEFTTCSPTGVNGELTTLYIGLYGVGVIAVYYTHSGEWNSYQSYGNYGRNFASGGNWSVISKSKTPPTEVINLIKNL